MSNPLELVRKTLNDLGYLVSSNDSGLVIQPSVKLRAAVALRCAANTIRIGMLLPLPVTGEESPGQLVNKLNNVTPSGAWSHSTRSNSLAWRESIPWDCNSPDAERALQRRISGRLKLCSRASEALATAPEKSKDRSEWVADILNRLSRFQPQREALPADQQVPPAEWEQTIARLRLSSQSTF